MGTDRPITLDLGMPSQSAFDTQTDTPQHTPADHRDAAQLEQEAQILRNLMQNRYSNTMPTNAATDAGTPTALATPFSLFGGATAVQAPLAAAPSALAPLPNTDVEQALSAMAQRLLVSDGSSGQRAVQIQLSGPTWAGVVMEVFEEGGDIVAQLVCRTETARERLAQAVQWLADTLACRLHRTVQVRVLADDPEDPCMVQAHASAGATPSAGFPPVF